MKARAIQEHLTGLWAELPSDTVDRVIYGDPEAEVTGIAVAWMPYLATLKQAHALGANVLVTHEPTFYHHRDLDDAQAAALPQTAEKRAWLDASGMVVIRCHDVWDAIPEVGIPFAWGRFLGLGEPTKRERYYNVYEVRAQTAGEFAREAANRTAKLGQAQVGFYGDVEAIVRTVGVGTGCISSPFRMYEMGADLAVSVDDVVRAWVAGEWCEDTGRPLLVVNHCVAEEPGIAELARHLAEAFPNVAVEHLPQTCTYRSVGTT